MPKLSKLFAVTRSFQGGATFESFDVGKFEKGVVAPIKKLLATAPPEFIGIAVVTCGEYGSKYAEEVKFVGNEDYNPTMNDDDFGNIKFMTPTTKHLCEAFPEDVASGRVVPILCRDWGLNAGSATAINAGIEVARRRDADKVMVWSPEIDLDGFMVHEMLCHKEIYALRLVGYMRNRWHQRLQWMFAQNTCVIWDMELLQMIGGMNPACNGDGKTMVSTIEYGEVPLAGMEDIEAYFRATAELGEFVRWGAVGQRHVATWNLALKKPGTREYDDNLKKIARQALVMDEYAKRFFPHLEPIDVYDQMIAIASLA